MKVAEAVDRSARDAERVAGADFDCASFEREGDDAFDAVDGLLAGVLAVGDGHPGSGGDVELEDGDGATGVLAFDEKTDCPTAPTMGVLITVVLLVGFGFVATASAGWFFQYRKTHDTFSSPDKNN